MKSILTIISIFTAAFLCTLTWFWFIEILIQISSWLETGQIIIGFSLNRTLYAIGVGLIPILGCLAVFFTKHYSISNLLMQTLNVTLGVIFIFFMAYLVASQTKAAPDPLLPDYITYAPFPGFWNFTLYAGLTFYVGTLITWSKLKNKLTTVKNLK